MGNCNSMELIPHTQTQSSNNQAHLVYLDQLIQIQKRFFFVAENDRQFKGSICIWQSLSLTKAIVNIMSLNKNSKEFVDEIEIPSCV